jgi:flagellar basal-body rod protein FlgC
MLSALDISSSGLMAQRTRLTAIANNIANVSTTHNEEGLAEAYQPRFAVFEADDEIRGPHGAVGVKADSIEIADVEPRWRYQPYHPDAIKEGPRQGYVAYPNVDLMTEFTDALEATRAYEANLGVIDVTKEMVQQTLRILA